MFEQFPHLGVPHKKIIEKRTFVFHSCLQGAIQSADIDSLATSLNSFTLTVISVAGWMKGFEALRIHKL